jgi:rhodanese-related sulfurtransferase
MPFVTLTIIFIAVIVLIVLLVKTDQDLESKVEEIEPEFLWKKIQEGQTPLIVDLRSPEEYRAGHIPGAELKDRAELPQWAETLRPEKEIILVCSNGKSSYKVGRILERGGFEFVEYLAGGMNEWPYEQETE